MQRELSAPFFRMQRRTSAPTLHIWRTVSATTLHMQREPVQKRSKKSALLGHLRTRLDTVQKQSKKRALLGFHRIVATKTSCDSDKYGHFLQENCKKILRFCVLTNFRHFYLFVQNVCCCSDLDIQWPSVLVLIMLEIFNSIVLRL